MNVNALKIMSNEEQLEAAIRYLAMVPPEVLSKFAQVNPALYTEVKEKLSN